MKTDAFDFDVPREMIAERPRRPRDAARLLEVLGDRVIDRRFGELPGRLEPGDVMVFNDTKVIPARLTGRRGEAKIEVTLHKERSDGVWDAFARPAKRLRPGDRIEFADGFTGEVVERRDGGEVRLAFAKTGRAFNEALAQAGAAPLPPYIRRPPDARDREDYQTVYASAPGAVAAPTAGLHFTKALLDALDARGIRRVFVTLHVGAGTFRPVSAADTSDHVMHSEWGRISAPEAEALNEARARGARLLAVGTTSLRLLEAASNAEGRVRPFEGEIDLFITPGYRFKRVDLLLTNFHLPRSTLFMLAAAFAGLEPMKAAYAHAIAEGYRFYSYGDATLLHRAERGDR